MLVINSQENQNVKEVRSLSTKKTRDAKGLFVVEGVRAVRDAFEAGAEIEKLFLSEKVINSGELGGKLMTEFAKSENAYLLREELFSKISGTESPQGVLAVVRQPEIDLDKLLSEANFVILLENVQDPGNLGTIVRTADAVGADLVLLAEGCVDVYNSKVVRSTMASLFHVPVARVGDMGECITSLKDSGLKVVATSGESEISYQNADLKGKIALVFGNEANGLTEDALELSDEVVSIPMPGRAESLNIAVAAGVIMFEKIATRNKM